MTNYLPYFQVFLLKLAVLNYTYFFNNKNCLITIFSLHVTTCHYFYNKKDKF